MNPDDCRLCGNKVEPAFRAKVLGRYDVQYFRCSGCGSLQTEVPYWLHEAYANGDAHSIFDTSRAARSRRTCATILAIYRLAGFKGPVLDFGGGTGLLCRMLRDASIDAYTFDEYDDGGFAKGFSSKIGDKDFDVVSAIEVLEHLPNPRSTLDVLFGSRAKVIVATTQLFGNEDESWSYLARSTGQHVFFYTQGALDWIASRYGYRWSKADRFWVFVRTDLPRQIQLRLRLLRKPAILLSDLMIPIQSRGGAHMDAQTLRKRHSGELN